MQQIFLDVYRAIDQFSPDRGKFKPWLLMFAYHRTLNQRRSLLAARFFDTDPLDRFTSRAVTEESAAEGATAQTSAC